MSGSFLSSLCICTFLDDCESRGIVIFLSKWYAYDQQFLMSPTMRVWWQVTDILFYIAGMIPTWKMKNYSKGVLLGEFYVI